MINYVVIPHFVLVWRSSKKTHDCCQLLLLIKAGLKRCIFSTQLHAMDSRIAVVCVVLAVFAVDQTAGAPQKDAVATGGSAYTNKYDHIDIDQVLASKRLVNSYVQCLLDKKPCTPEGAELRKILPDALKTQCAKCSNSQKNAALKVVERLQRDYDKEWKLLLDKWDPKREQFQKFQQFLTEEKKKNGGVVKF